MFTKILLWALGVPKQVWLGLAALALLSGAVWYCDRQLDNRVEEAEEKGAEKERTIQLEETVKNVEKADEARKDIADKSPLGDCIRYNQCLRTARTPENCKRFLPDVQSSDK